MIVGVGVDVCEVGRLRKAMQRAGFRERVFGPGEIRYCEGRARRDLHYAARFAAKEALFKAIGTGWGEGVGWQDVAVRSDGRTPPLLEISGGAARRARALGMTRAHLSLSHGGDYAVAMVVLEGRRRRAAPRSAGRR